MKKIRQLSEQLEAANKELEAFTYSISHDLRAGAGYFRIFTNLWGRVWVEAAVDQGVTFYFTLGQ